jgi:AcrR family transcriptional regulator
MEPKYKHKSIQVLQEEMQTMKMKVDGATVAEIAETLGLSQSSVFRRLSSAIELVRDEVRFDTQHYIDMEVAKLDKLESRIYKRISLEPDNNEMVQLSGAVVKLSESRRKLLGIDAPQRVEHSGPLFTVSEASPLTKAWPDATNEATLHEDQVPQQEGGTEEP